MEKKFPPEAIEGERILLKKHDGSEELAQEIFARVDADRERLREFLPWVDLTRSLNDEQEYLRSCGEQWEAGELFDYGIFSRATAEFLGTLGVHRISWPNSRCELGYWLSSQAEGKGYASEAVRALESTLFALGFHRIEIHCSSSNERSSAVPRRCGYRLEGHLREDSLEGGKRRDTLIFGKLASD